MEQFLNTKEEVKKMVLGVRRRVKRRTIRREARKAKRKEKVKKILNR